MDKKVIPTTNHKSKSKKQTLSINNKTSKLSAKEKIERLIRKHPDRVPVLVKVCEKDKDKIKLRNEKFLVERDFEFGQFHVVVRNEISLEPSQAIYLFVNSNLLPQGASIGEIYNQYKNEEDLMLHIVLAMENTFG